MMLEVLTAATQPVLSVALTHFFLADHLLIPAFPVLNRENLGLVQPKGLARGMWS